MKSCIFLLTRYKVLLLLFNNVRLNDEVQFVIPLIPFKQLFLNIFIISLRRMSYGVSRSRGQSCFVVWRIADTPVSLARWQPGKQTVASRQPLVTARLGHLIRPPFQEVATGPSSGSPITSHTKRVKRRLLSGLARLLAPTDEVLGGWLELGRGI